MVSDNNSKDSIWPGWGGMCHPDAPCGGGGSGSFRLPGPLGTEYSSCSALPHPHSPAGKQILPADIDKAYQHRNRRPKASISQPIKPYPKWTVADAAMWKLWSESKGGGNTYLFLYKDGWIVHNKSAIKAAANSSQIPVDLLAGVAWAEVGGMPDIIDSIAYPVRSFDWSGPDWVDNNLTVTKNPYQTSVGSVSIQLRNVAKIMGVNLNKLTYMQQLELIKYMENDASNLEIVAKYLLQLIKYDFPNGSTIVLNDMQMIVVASRYNRGTARDLSDFIKSIEAPVSDTTTRAYTSYGRTLLRHREHVRSLLL